jgi:hypothetical protein
MQLQLNVNDMKANILLGLLDIFKQDNLITDYKIINHQKYTQDEKEILEDLAELKASIAESGTKTDKYIVLNDL